MRRRGVGGWVRIMGARWTRPLGRQRTGVELWAAPPPRLDGGRGLVALGLSVVLVLMVPSAATAAPSWVAPVNAPMWGGFKEPAYHHGVDLGAERWVPIRAASAGTVITSTCNASLDGEPYSCDIDGSPQVQGCGWYIDVAHADGVVTRYCHMVVAPLVEVGDEVQTGERVGYVGSSGNSSAPHLHFEVHLVPEKEGAHNGNAIDPVPFMAKRGAPLGVGKDKPEPPSSEPAPAAEPATPQLAVDGRSDMDGDGLTDLVVWRPADGQWHIRLAADALVFESPADAGEPGAAAELSAADAESLAAEALAAEALTEAAEDVPAVHGPAEEGAAADSASAGIDPEPVTLGVAGDVPVVADYDGDGKDDLAVWRPVDGRWLVQTSSGAPVTDMAIGGPGDIPVPGDYDGNGFADFAVWRPADGQWFVRPNTGTADGAEPAAPVTFGQPGDLPVVADYDGDGRDDLAVWRPVDGQWLVAPSAGGTPPQVTLGAEGDIPVPGDFDGDGRADFSAWRPSVGVWTVAYATGAPAEPVAVGLPGDEPVVGDYDGDAKDDLALWRRTDGQWIILASSGERLATGEPGTGIVFGAPGDQPANRPLWLDENGEPPTLGETLLRERVQSGTFGRPTPTAQG